ncbi:SH2 domain-containing protein 1B isoform X2 [Desmodus rotundus]|uniref:SH2 domain-containing protein 1B isoform X2 n=1 Tax=Desmodus rotundus TaxID=9430 RepID=UPI0023811FBC|nr:SH2 domain-containing protein 1B isoform X2 [Desmodus rotundus]XP_053772219.1 SH2 domain-containing protein 1B isoform X2 [Desmodus rotundus]
MFAAVGMLRSLWGHFLKLQAELSSVLGAERGPEARLFRNFVYTYRIFKEKYGQYKIQTADGAPTQAFPNLRELVSKFKKPNQGLVFPLLTPVERARPCLKWQSSKVDLDDDYENCSSDYVEVLP